MDKRVLVIDDEAPILMALKKLLSFPNVMVDVADSMDQAQRLMEANDYHIVVTDLRLSGTEAEEGFDIIEAAKARNSNTRTILITAYDSSEVKARAQRLGVSYLFEKPLSIHTLRHALAHLSEKAGQDIA